MEAPVHLHLKAAGAAAGVVAPLPAAEVGAADPGCLGGARPVEAPRAVLPAGWRGWAVGAVEVAVEVLLRKLVPLQMGDLSPARTGNPGREEGKCQLLGLDGFAAASPPYACALSPSPTHPHLPGPRLRPKPTSLNSSSRRRPPGPRFYHPTSRKLLRTCARGAHRQPRSRRITAARSCHSDREDLDGNSISRPPQDTD